ncbi:TMEM175 family protein [Halorarius litoreus]|uniref:TMEM175 family protein n=1 Tax=Halorarius litoreus TaxID=2962676 RepID=UPI0020CD724E|nr:TMEM175 family protein [Halorarius litoreus]
MVSAVEFEARETDRLKAFSDGVIAIVITLLVLEITVPELPPGAAVTTLPGVVFEQWPEFFGFTLSFLVVGLYWTLHRRVFLYIDRHSKGVLWLNLVFLLFVAFIPYAVSMFTTYFTTFGVVFYALVQAVTGLSLMVLWAYSMRKSLFRDGLPTHIAQVQGLRFLATPVIFFVSIPLAIVAPLFGVLSWLLVLPVNAAFESRLASDLGDRPIEVGGE